MFRRFYFPPNFALLLSQYVMRKAKVKRPVINTIPNVFVKSFFVTGFLQSPVLRERSLSAFPCMKWYGVNTLQAQNQYPIK